jgi:putative SbcD/Mre11-related phosphoesterase
MPEEYALSKEIILSGESCAYLPESDTVVLSDLHLGFELAMEEKGLFLPRLQVRIELERMGVIIERYRPSTIVVNGDLKHDFSRNSPQEWVEIKKLFEFLSSKTKVVVVKGNHDNYILNIASKFNIETLPYYLAGDILLAHGDVEIEGFSNQWTIIGHEHPAIRVRDAIGAQYKFPVFLYLKRSGILVLPAFSPFSLGTDVLTESREFMSPYLRNIEEADAVIFAIDKGQVRKLGSLSDIRSAALQ